MARHPEQGTSFHHRCQKSTEDLKGGNAEHQSTDWEARGLIRKSHTRQPQIPQPDAFSFLLSFCSSCVHSDLISSIPLSLQHLERFSGCKLPCRLCFGWNCSPYMGESNRNITELAACLCALVAGQQKKMTSWLFQDFRSAAQSDFPPVHRSQNLDSRQKQLSLPINICSGAQEYSKRNGSEMVPFLGDPSDFPNPITNFLIACHEPFSSLFLFKALQFASLEPVKCCLMMYYAINKRRGHAKNPPFTTSGFPARNIAM